MNDEVVLKDVRVRYAFQYEREKTFLKAYLLGKGYFRAIKALGFIERCEFMLPPEERYRKDKVTPSLHHQVRIALSITNLKGLINEELCLVTALLHDVQEDHDVHSDVIAKEFGGDVASVNWKVTKKFSGSLKSKDEYTREIALDMIASIVKGVDRLDNLDSMIGVFSLEKMKQYSTEAEQVFLPMIKSASKLFPEQLQAYHTIMIRMKQQIIFARKYVEAMKYEQICQSLTTDLTTQINKYKDLDEVALDLKDELKQLKNFQLKSSDLTHDEALETFRNMFKKFVKHRAKISVADLSEIIVSLAEHLKLSSLEVSNFSQDEF